MTERHSGTVVNVGGLSAIVGGGMYGATSELDAIVQKAAALLETAFGIPTVIRFNSDQRSGGAFLKDGRTDFWANGQVGLGAGLHPIRPVGMSDEQWWALRSWEYEKLPQTIRIHTIICWESLLDDSQANEGLRSTERKPYAYHTHATLEEALAYLLQYAEPAMAQVIY